MARAWTLLSAATVVVWTPAGAAWAQSAGDATPVTDGERDLALTTALEAAGLPADTVPRMVKSNGRVSDPRTIGVYLTVPDPELDAQTSQVLVEVRLQPRVYVSSISWGGRRARRATAAAALPEAYEKARTYAAGQFPLWDDRRTVLTTRHAWDGVSAGRPGSDVVFAWQMADGGFPAGWCQVSLDGTPPLVSAYYASIAPVPAPGRPALRALSCLPVAQALCQAGGWSPAVVDEVRHEPAQPAAQGHGPHWGFSFWYTMEGYCGLTGCSIDATTGRLVFPEMYESDPDVVGAAERTRDPLPGAAPRPGPPPRVPRDDRQAVATAAEFLGLSADALRPRVTWAEGWGGEGKALLAVDVPATQDVPAHTVELEVQAAAPYYVSRAHSPTYPGLESRAAGLGDLPWQFAWDFSRHRFTPWSSTMAGETTRSEDPRTNRFWYHSTDHLVRTGTWALTEVRGHLAEGRGSLYVSRYEARRAPERSLAEMQVDLLDAVETVRAHVEAQPGAVFLLSYGVPVLSHPASPGQNPAWEIRYFVGPGGPEPIIRWAAVDATDGSLIYVDHAL
ncbi:MAG: hypothetical protein FJX74_11760, partial [Armatimonadetes bacterium]|nr:hypothetical protein [Armatimonadota bacterium]